MKKFQTSNILIYFQDVGSSNYLLEIVKTYKFKKNHKLFLLFNRNVSYLYDKFNNTNSHNIFKFNTIYKKKRIFFKNFISKNNIDLVICTCSQTKLDKSNFNLIKEAIYMNLRILTFLDQWKAIDRFKHYVDNNSNLFIGVIEKNQKKLIKKNLNIKNIFVTGHPNLEKIKIIKRKEGKNSILFVSEPDVNLKFKSRFLNTKNNATLFTILLKDLSVKYPKINFFFRKHPKETTNLNKYTKKYNLKIDNLDENKSLKKFQNMLGFETIFLKKGILSGANVMILKKDSDLSINKINFKTIDQSKVFNQLKKTIYLSKIRCHKLLNKVIKK
ncbi:hypothetical protein OAQ39_02325 [Alphaproteobacteria bacterium]|nr:hypothetical protein [Alphaproteobacteria bacterium]